MGVFQIMQILYSITIVLYCNRLGLYYIAEWQQQIQMAVSAQIIPILTLIITTILRIHCDRCEQWKLDDHTILVQTSMGISMFVDGKDRGISRTIRQKGIHNDKLIELMKKFVRENESVVYVGAHVGIQVLALAKYSSDSKYSNFRIHALEPSQLNYILLSKSVYLNDLQHIVRVYKAAVTDVSGTAELAIRNIDTSAADIVPVTTTRRKADYKYEVTTVTIDAVLNADIVGGHKFGLVYLSCNGYEIEAMLGMKNLLANNKNASVLLRWSFMKNGHKNVDGLISLLKDFQNNFYRLFIVDLNENAASAPISSPYTQITTFMQVTKLNQNLLLFIPSSRINILGIS